MHLMMILLPALLLLIFLNGTAHAAFPGTVVVQSIQIVPVETTAGNHPEIIGTIKANSARASEETIDINVIATLARPDNTVKSWIWKKIRIKAGEAKGFSIPKEYDVKLGGVYRLDFGVYSEDMRPLNRLTKNFSVVDPLRPRVGATSREIVTGRASPSSRNSTGRPTDDRHIAVGVYANAVNSAGGATLLLWPHKYVGLQGSYTMGTFSTAEVRVLARFPLSERFNPYLGVGYASVTAERTVDIIGLKTTFRDTGVSGAIGIEIPLSKRISGYVEISGAAIDLKKEVTNGVQKGTATVKYSPLTAGFSIMYFLF